MEFKDKIKFDRLKEIFDDNFRLTRIYANYLEYYPEILSEDMVMALCDSGFTKEEAIAALLSQMFGLDFNNPADRRIIMNYLTPSIRVMDAKKYTENPYYKRIKIPNVTDGDWELKQESYKAYRGVIVGDMVTDEDFREYPPLGFFTEEFRFPAVLEGGNEWMTLTPVDLDTCDEAIEAAWGKVVTFGLGLGYYAFMVSEKAEVESITVIEKSPDVIRLFERYILPYFRHPKKVKIVNADAFEYAEKIMPKEGFDLAFVDTWRDAGDGAPMYRQMKKLEHLSPNTKFMYWIEGFLKSRVRAERFEEIKDAMERGRDFSYGEVCDLLNEKLLFEDL